MLGKITSRFRGCFMPAKSSSTSTQTPANPRAESPRASAESPAHGNLLSGTRPGSPSDGKPESGAKPESGLKPGEEKLAGYLLARTAMHRKIDDRQVLTNLRAGQASLQEVAERMPLGSANVIEDNEKAKDEHLPSRILASEYLRRAMNAEGTGCRIGGPKDSFTRKVAAVGQHAQTGTCGTFAAVSAPVHAAKLPALGDKRAVVAQTDIDGIDHAWTEMMPKGKGKDGKPIPHEEDVILDGWCKEKIAILREDGGFAQLDEDGKGDHLNHNDILDYKSGPKALQSVEKYKARIENSPELKFTFRKYFERSAREGVKIPDGWFYNSMSVFHDDFRYQASESLHRDVWKVQRTRDIMEMGRRTLDSYSTMEETMTRFRAERYKHASLTEIQAVGVARSLGANIRGAKAEAPTIIGSATELFPRLK